MTSRGRKAESLLALIGAGLILAGGCVRSSPSKHYTLAWQAVHDESESGAVIGVGPVTVPIHLRQPSLVARRDAYRLAYLDFHRWAQPVEDGIPQVIGENLSRLTGAKRVVYFPWGRSEAVTHQVALRILAFEMDAAGQGVFEARWSLRDGQGRRLDGGVMTLREDAGGDPSRLAAALSECLLRFCVEVQSRIQP